MTLRVCDKKQKPLGVSLKGQTVCREAQVSARSCARGSSVLTFFFFFFLRFA